jgi:pantothenate kinase
MHHDEPQHGWTHLPDLAEVLRRTQSSRRRVVAIAGAPGSGKSTFAETLCADLNRSSPDFARVLAMDGFHFDDRVLDARGQRARKGAPHTFDVGGLGAMLDRLRADDGSEIAVPVFDRSLEISRAGAALIPGAVRLILVEGNYLLLDDPGWTPLRARFDATVMVEVPRERLIERLTARWRGYGYEDAALRAKLDGNDLVNADLIASHSMAADWYVLNV